MKEITSIEEVRKFMESKDGLPVAPDGTNDQSVYKVLEQGSTPDKKEKRRIGRRVKRIWNNWRSNVLEQINIENYRKYCELEVLKYQTESKLREEKHKREKEDSQHWLEMHKGNLIEIGYNVDSIPNKYYYSLERWLFYFKKRCSSIPKLIWYIGAGLLGIGTIILATIGILKIK